MIRILKGFCGNYIILSESEVMEIISAWPGDLISQAHNWNYNKSLQDNLNNNLVISQIIYKGSSQLRKNKAESFSPHSLSTNHHQCEIDSNLT